ncbi:hypothetical protein MWU59_04845 [Flavobacteriaceae bacterium F08102]|nr:hypothetical protein [Flavobacteriaceae bacterium F08102]
MKNSNKEILTISFTILALISPFLMLFTYAKEPMENEVLEEILPCDSVTNSSLQIRFEGSGFYPVELDGYGVVKDVHWPVVPEYPYSSPTIPTYYINHGSPVAYLRNSKPSIQVKAQLASSITGKGELIGKSDHLRFKGKAAITNGFLSAFVVSDNRLPDHIASWEDEEIEWILTVNDSKYNLGKSKNSIYILLDQPIMSLLHTPLKIASMAGKGLTDKKQIVDRVWQRFRDQQVTRARDQYPLMYYGLYKDKAPAELRRMLMAGSGQCVAWAYLLYATLGTQGIQSQIILVAPPGRGRLFIKNWNFIEGTQFINTGKNGVNETGLSGDDIAIIPKGHGRPFSKIWVSGFSKTKSLTLDDKGLYETGPNGIVDTKISSEEAIPLIPYKFGLPNQRLYVLKKKRFSRKVKLGGDDLIVNQLNNTYVLSGPNGIVETPHQKIFREGVDGKPHPFISWHPKIGVGATHINFTYAMPKPLNVPKVSGDDIKESWWINSGENGISDTPGANYQKGAPFSIAVQAGPDEKINSQTGGDDEFVDIKDLMKNAPNGYKYINTFNMYPVPGVKGQNNSSPPTDYPNHVIVQIGDAYYDPSYGTGPFNTQHEWEKASLAGVGQQIRDENNKFIKFNKKIMFYVKPVQDDEVITKFTKTINPN